MLYSLLLKKVYAAVLGPMPEPPGAGEATGLVLVADGIGGLDLCGTSLRYAVARAGLRHWVHVLGWGHGFGRWYRDLTNVENHAARAVEIVDAVTAFRAGHPDTPAFLVGKSGGTGLVVWALEQLPGEAVERAILLAPALSPDYDLSRALQAVRRELVVFWSPLDVILLGAGTRIFGTVDRVRTVSAGMVGFRTPLAADPAAYAKLRHVRWHPRMGKTGYLGGHIGPDLPPFLQKYVVPLLRVAEETVAEPGPGSSRTRAAPIS